MNWIDVMCKFTKFGNYLTNLQALWCICFIHLLLYNKKNFLIGTYYVYKFPNWRVTLLDALCSKMFLQLIHITCIDKICKQACVCLCIYMHVCTGMYVIDMVNALQMRHLCIKIAYIVFFKLICVTILKITCCKFTTGTTHERSLIVTHQATPKTTNGFLWDQYPIYIRLTLSTLHIRINAARIAARRLIWCSILTLRQEHFSDFIC